MSSKNLEIYFLRHGQTTASRGHLFAGQRINPGLTPEGEEMAAEFGAAYKDLKWEAIYASTLKRAQDTAAPLARETGVRISDRKELMEIDYGVWDGKTLEEVEKNYHDDYIRWSADPAWNAPTGGGETAIAIARRSRGVIEEIRENHKTGRVLVVSHKATIRIMICDLLGIDLSRFRDRLLCPVASVSIVEFGARGPLLTLLADRSHMSERLRMLPGT